MDSVFTKKLRAKLERIPKIAVEAASAQMEIEAQKIVEKMKAAAPKESGDLRDSIGWTWGEVPNGSLVIGTISRGHDKGEAEARLNIKIYAGKKDAFYARFIEFGTQPHSVAKGAKVWKGRGQDKGPHHPGTTPQPFFFSVWKAEKKKAQQQIAKAIKRAIKEKLNG